MTFAHGWIAALALASASGFVVFALRSEHRSRAAALEYSSLPFLEEVLQGAPPWSAIFALVWAAAIVALGFGAARPSVVASVPVRDAAVVLCIDTSGSMASTDVVPTRAAAARAAAEAFIDGVPSGTRLGLVAFSASALPLGPLTADRAAARDELARLPPPNGGTAIGDALAVAAHLLPPVGRRAIVLVTDGVNNSGSDPLAIARAVGGSGITLFTVGIGTNGSGDLIPGTGEEAQLDEDALREIARDGNGTYARVGDARALQDRLGGLARTTIRERRRVDLTIPCALGGGLLAVLTAFAALALGRFP